MAVAATRSADLFRGFSRLQHPMLRAFVLKVLLLPFRFYRYMFRPSCLPLLRAPGFLGI